jgi:hypothetical protein
MIFFIRNCAINIIVSLLSNENKINLLLILDGVITWIVNFSYFFNIFPSFKYFFLWKKMNSQQITGPCLVFVSKTQRSCFQNSFKYAIKNILKYKLMKIMGRLFDRVESPTRITIST